MFKSAVFAGLVLLLCAAGAKAAPIITLTTYDLEANQPGQTILIDVSGGTAVQGLTLYVQVSNDGGPPPTGRDGPAITGVDILTGTIFASNNTGSDNPGSTAQVAERTTTTSSGTVSTSGLLATLTIDTTGYDNGTYALELSGTVAGTTNFAGVAADITNGQITIVPEPSSAVSILILTCGLLLLVRRRPARAVAA